MLFDWGNFVDVVIVADLLTGIWFLCVLMGWLICGMPWYTGTSEVRQFHPSVALSGFTGTALRPWAYMCCCLLLVVPFWTIEWVVASIWYWYPSLCFCCLWVAFVAYCLLLVHVALVDLDLYIGLPCGCPFLCRSGSVLGFWTVARGLWLIGPKLILRKPD
jgi:hypothetical protein